jgi:hypothetical protein
MVTNVFRCVLNRSLNIHSQYQGEMGAIKSPEHGLNGEKAAEDSRTPKRWRAAINPSPKVLEVRLSSAAFSRIPQSDRFNPSRRKPQR